MKTRVEQISDLFRGMWTSNEDNENFHLEELLLKDQAIFRIRSRDLTTIYATVYCARTRIPGKDGELEISKGYGLEINYPAFNGSLTEMLPFIHIINVVKTIVDQMQHSKLIKKAA